VRSTPVKPKLYPFAPRSEAMRRLMRSCAFVLAVNWLAQGMRGMDRKELAFRLLAESLAAAILSAALSGLGAVAVLPAALIAHSLNFTFNGQFWVCARYCRSYRRQPQDLDRYVSTAVTRLQATPWLDSALLIGSQGLGVGTRTDRSDIDLRLLFPSGIIGWLRCNALLLAWRTEALFRRIPLDLFAYDHAGSLGRFNQSEPLLEILDRAGRLRTRFPDRHWTSAT